MRARLVETALVFAVGAPAAHAGAWSQPEGSTLDITNVSRERGEYGETWRVDTLSELGLSGGWSGHFKVETMLRASDVYDDRTAGEIGLRKSFAIAPRIAAAAEVSVLSGESFLAADCKETGFEYRGSIGASHAFGRHESFINVDLTSRSRGDGCVRGGVEIASGIDLTDSWRVLGKAWREDGNGGRTAKIEALLIRDFKSFSLGAGVRREVSGDFEERGVVATLWMRR